MERRIREEVASDDVADAAKVDAAAQIFHLLIKGIKNIGIYRHAEARFIEFLDPAFQALSSFLEANESLPLKISPYALEFKKQVIYEDKDRENLTYKFYRDGMRFLVFRSGLPSDELLRFVLLAIASHTDRALAQEDMVTRFWKEDFKFIEHVVVDGFAFGDFTDEQVELEVEKVVGYLRKQLSSNSKDVTRFARLSLEDLELQLTDVDQIRGGIISGRPAKPEDKAWVQDELYQEEKERIFAKMVLILLQVLELDSAQGDFDLLNDSFMQILDSLLVTEDVKGAVALLRRLESVLAKKLPASRVALAQKITGEFRRKMAEPQRLETLGQYIATSRSLDEAAVRAYLSVCTETELIKLVEILAGMERQEGRRVLIEVLAELGKGHVEIFARRLDHNSSNVVRDMLAIITLINPEDKLRYIARTLDHPNIMIRLEGLKALAKANDASATKYLEKATADSDIQMRLGAYRALALRGGDKAAPFLIKLMQADDFAGKDGREKVAIATALGETRGALALGHFDQIFSTKSGLFGRGKNTELRMMAVAGLQAMRSVEAFKILAREVQNMENGKEVMQAAHKAAVRLKEDLSRPKGGENG